MVCAGARESQSSRTSLPRQQYYSLQVSIPCAYSRLFRLLTNILRQTTSSGDRIPNQTAIFRRANSKSNPHAMVYQKE